MKTSWRGNEVAGAEFSNKSVTPRKYVGGARPTNMCSGEQTRRGFDIVECDPSSVLHQYDHRKLKASRQSTNSSLKSVTSTHLVACYGRIQKKLRKLQQLEEYRIRLINSIAKLGLSDNASDDVPSLLSTLGPSIFNIGSANTEVLVAQPFSRQKSNSGIDMLSNNLLNEFDDASAYDHERLEDCRHQFCSSACYNPKIFTEELNRQIIESQELNQQQDLESNNQNNEDENACIEAISLLETEMSSNAMMDMFGVLESTMTTLFAKGHVDPTVMYSIASKAEGEMQRCGIGLDQCKDVCYRQNLRKCFAGVRKLSPPTYDSADNHSNSSNSSGNVLDAVINASKRAEVERLRQLSTNYCYRSLQSRWEREGVVTATANQSRTRKGNSKLSKGSNQIMGESFSAAELSSHQLGFGASASSSELSPNNETMRPSTAETTMGAGVAKLRKLRSKHKKLLLRAISACKPLCPFEIVLNNS